MSTFDDTVFECVDNFVVLIGDSNPAVTLGVPSSATVEIVNNDGKDSYNSWTKCRVLCLAGM